MSTKSTKRKVSELLNTQSNANGGNGNNPPSSNDNSNDNDGYKHINYPIENTPFRVIGNERDGFILVMGKHRLTDPVDTPTECEKQLDEKPFEILFHMVATMLEINENLRTSTIVVPEIMK